MCLRATEGSSTSVQYLSDECIAILLNNSLGGRRVKAELLLQGHGPVAHRLLERLLLNHVIVCVRVGEVDGEVPAKTCDHADAFSPTASQRDVSRLHLIMH